MKKLTSCGYTLTGRSQLFDQRWLMKALAYVAHNVSELPNGCGVAMRLLGPTSLEVKNAVHLAWNTARLMLVGVPAPDLRKG